MSCGGSHHDNANAAVISDTVKSVNVLLEESGMDVRLHESEGYQAFRSALSQARVERGLIGEKAAAMTPEQHEEVQAVARERLSETLEKVAARRQEEYNKWRAIRKAHEEQWVKSYGEKGAWAMPLTLTEKRGNGAENWLSADGTMMLRNQTDEAEFYTGRGWDEPETGTCQTYDAAVMFRLDPTDIPNVYRAPAFKGEDDDDYWVGVRRNDDGNVEFVTVEEHDDGSPPDIEGTSLDVEDAYSYAEAFMRDYIAVDESDSSSVGIEKSKDGTP